MNENVDYIINNDHKMILDILLEDISNNDIHNIVDLGTGRTSLKYLTERFNAKNIVAITYPGDLRKINSIRESVRNNNFTLVQADLQKYETKEKYDLALAHLLLGEAGKFIESSFERLLKKILEINARYLVIIDYKEDPSIDYTILEEYSQDFGRIQKKAEISRKEPFISENFIGRIFKGYLIMKK